MDVKIQDLKLNSKLLQECLPDMAFVRQDRQKTCDIAEVNVLSVWLVSRSVDVCRNSYTLLLRIENENQSTQIELTKKEYDRFRKNKYIKSAFTAIQKILKKSDKNLYIRKMRASKKMSFRATKRIADKIRNNSRKCGISESQYIIKCCDGITPRLALNNDQQSLLRELAKGRQDYQFLLNMMSVWKKEKSPEEIAKAVIEGERFGELRSRLVESINKFDAVLGRLINNQIEN